MLKSLPVIIILVVFLLLQGMAFAQVNPARKLEADSVKADSLRVSSSITKSLRQQEKEEAYYKIEIKEKRSNDNFWTKGILSGFNNRKLRTNLIGYRSYFPKPLDESYTILVEKAFRFPVIFFVLAITLAIAANVLLVIAVLFLTNLIMNYRKKKGKRLRSFYEKVLTDLLLQVTDTSEAIRQLSKAGLKKDYDLLIDVMMDFQKSFRGDSDRQIIALYQEMELGRNSYNKTFAVSFYKQIKGIRELTNMHPFHATEMIFSRLNDPNDIVRSEAQICYPHVNKENPFDFLGFLEKPFSKWAQLNIFYFIKMHEMPVPSFEKWINSGNPNVVNFCIRMIDLFQQQENSPHLIEQLKNSDESTRRLAINACGTLHVFESKNLLKQNFPTETVSNQLEIIKTFSFIGDATDIAFLGEVVQTGIISLRLEGCRTLFNLSDAGRSHLEELNLSMNFELSPFIAHVKDPRN